MTHFDLDMTATPIIISGIFQGVGIGLIFVPLSALAFTTLAPRLRSEATGVYTLMRNLGSSVGISIMQALWTANSSVAHSTLAAHVIPGDTVVNATLGPSLGMPAGLEALNDEITRQGAMVAYLDDFKLLLLITVICLPLLLFMRTPRIASEAVNAFVE
jgi:DHA2 family multidrug resistance protein